MIYSRIVQDTDLPGYPSGYPDEYRISIRVSGRISEYPVRPNFENERFRGEIHPSMTRCQEINVCRWWSVIDYVLKSRIDSCLIL